jgi:hypothetical protein
MKKRLKRLFWKFLYIFTEPSEYLWQEDKFWPHNEKWYRTVIRKLYKKYVDDLYIPKDSRVTIKSYPKVAKKEGISSVLIACTGNNRLGNQERYLFPEFNEIIYFK